MYLLPSLLLLFHHFPLPWFTHSLLLVFSSPRVQLYALRLPYAFATHPLPSAAHSSSPLLSALLTTCSCSPSTSCHSTLPRFPSCFSSVTSPTPHWFLSIPGLFCFPPLSFSNWYFYKPHSRCQVKAPPRQVVALRTCAAQWSRPGWEIYVVSSYLRLYPGCPVVTSRLRWDTVGSYYLEIKS